MDIEPTVYELKNQPVVCVTWVDIVGQGGWLESNEVYELVPLKMETYGKIVIESSDYITITSTWSEDCEETFGDTNVIPRGVIKGIRILAGAKSDTIS